MSKDFFTDPAVARLLRHGAVGRDRLAAGGRRHAGEIRRRRHRLDGASQHHHGRRSDRHDGLYEPVAFLAGHRRDPVIVVPLVAFGRTVRRRSRAAQDTLAGATAYASEAIGAVRTLQAFTNEAMVTRTLRRAPSKSAFEAARASIKARAFLTGFAIFMIFSSVVGVLWFGSHGVLAGTMSTGHARPVPALFGIRGELARLAVGGLGRTQPGIGRGRTADGDPGRGAGDHARPPTPVALPEPADRRRSPSMTSSSPIRRGPTARRCTA